MFPANWFIFISRGTVRAGPVRSFRHDTKVPNPHRLDIVNPILHAIPPRTVNAKI
jgi:hypothetical protein